MRVGGCLLVVRGISGSDCEALLIKVSEGPQDVYLMVLLGKTYADAYS